MASVSSDHLCSRQGERLAAVWCTLGASNLNTFDRVDDYDTLAHGLHAFRSVHLVGLGLLPGLELDPNGAGAVDKPSSGAYGYFGQHHQSIRYHGVIWTLRTSPSRNSLTRLTRCRSMSRSRMVAITAPHRHVRCNDGNRSQGGGDGDREPPQQRVTGRFVPGLRCRARCGRTLVERTGKRLNVGQGMVLLLLVLSD